MELKNSKINFLGDSITEGHGTSGAGFRFTELIEKDYGLKAARNYGIGGSRFARQLNPLVPANRMDLDFCMRALEMDEDADAVVVFGGTNDFGHGDAPIGSFDDREPCTFYGACHTLMSELIERYPGKPIVFVTPLHRTNEDNPKGDMKPEPVAILAEYVAIIKEVAAYYSLPVLDLFSAGLLQPRVPVVQQMFVPDGLHPNDAGHRIIAGRLAHFLQSL